jgi:hypothetical protein
MLLVVALAVVWAAYAVAAAACSHVSLPNLLPVENAVAARDFAVLSIEVSIHPRLPVGHLC